jgi:hypothetical protein
MKELLGLVLINSPVVFLTTKILEADQPVGLQCFAGAGLFVLTIIANLAYIAKITLDSS